MKFCRFCWYSKRGVIYELYFTAESTRCSNTISDFGWWSSGCSGTYDNLSEYFMFSFVYFTDSFSCSLLFYLLLKYIFLILVLHWQIMLKPQEKVVARPGKLAGIGFLISFYSCWIVKYMCRTDFGSIHWAMPYNIYTIQQLQVLRVLHLYSNWSPAWKLRIFVVHIHFKNLSSKNYEEFYS